MYSKEKLFRLEIVYSVRTTIFLYYMFELRFVLFLLCLFDQNPNFKKYCQLGRWSKKFDFKVETLKKHISPEA